MSSNVIISTIFYEKNLFSFRSDPPLIVSIFGPCTGNVE